ncbi:RNA polymerase sigma factor [Plantactinospora sp. GCM10030261]|uniref:RNA polymerase sigma factor n=1 Tax=Plantactinospora sp. GCM10030261 TaxID=3273420 RepID=UPI0036169564
MRSWDVASPVEGAVHRAYEQEWGYVLAAAARVAADLDLAEDCVQDAYAQALVHWRSHGVPRRPGAWLTTVATRRALEQRRRADTLRRKLPLLVPDEGVRDEPETVFPDDRLRLVFTCCHPALSREAQVALTLRLVCGVSGGEIARAFLIKEATVQARITRAKRKIAGARIPYRVPGPADLPHRVEAVLDVVHLVYTGGHTATSGTDLMRADLAHRGLDLARMMHRLLPGVGEVRGLLALLVLTQARSAARTDRDGRLVLLGDQDRTLWDRDAIGEGLELVRGALARPPAGRFALMAAIAAVHAEAPTWVDTDWPQILGLYDLLLARWPSPVVALNRAVAVSHAHGTEAGLAAIAELAVEPGLASYPYLAATRAELLRRAGDRAGAVVAYEEALLLTDNQVEADHLARRLAGLRAGRG